MAPEKLCVCDRTCEKLIGAKLNLVDTTHIPFLKLVNTLSNVPESGLWLNHFRGIPTGQRPSHFDVIYLDEEARVLDCIENFTEVEFEPLRKNAESALVLPAHALASMKVRPGDQFRICQGGNVLAGRPALQGRRCVRDEVVHEAPEAPKETKSTFPGNLAALETQKPDRSWKERFLQWLFPESNDRRNGDRRPAQDLVAYFWTGGSPMAYKVENVSHSGLYLYTEERWLPGTRVMMTLQKAGVDAAGPNEISRVESEVVRWGEGGIGCRFVEAGFIDLNSGEIVQGRVFDKVAFDRFLERVIGPVHS